MEGVRIGGWILGDVGDEWRRKVQGEVEAVICR